MATNEQVHEEEKEGRYWWIQLKQKVGQKNWTFSQVKYLHGLEQGFQSEIGFKPNWDNIDCVSYGTPCRYCHKDISFKFFISSTSNSDHLHLRLCYLPKSTEARKEYYNNKSHSHNQDCRSYIWFFDSFLVKMKFTNAEDPSKGIARQFHLESGNGCCKDDDHLLIVKDELAHLTENRFISKTEFERETGYKMLSDQQKFVPAEIMIRARLFLLPFQGWNETVETVLDDNCYLKNKPKFHHLQSESIPSVSGYPFFLEKRCLECVPEEWEPNVIFQVGSDSDNVILPAHSWILATHSPVLFKMLTINMEEKKSGTITLDNQVSIEGLQMFLGFLYEKSGYSYSREAGNFGAETLNGWNADLSFKVLQMAHQYQVTALIDFTVENIISRPDLEFSFQLMMEVFRAGDLYQKPDLQCRSVQWAKRQLQSDKFGQTRNAVEELLKQDTGKENLDFVRRLL